MNDCPHGDGAHWVGDCGDLDAIPKADWMARANREAQAAIDVRTAAWLRTLGAIQ